MAKQVSTSKKSAIKRCADCKPHAYQDRRYGDKMRVMNWSRKHDTFRCTVDGASHGTSKG